MTRHTPPAPLNRDQPFTVWPRLEPGRWIDFNPCCVQLPSGRWLGVIRRDAVPPVPGKGTLWTVPLDDALRPAGPPTLLLAQGEDPRAVCIGDRVWVFHAIIERDAQGRVNGSAVRLLECAIDGDPGAERLRPLQLLQLPKNPLNRPRTGSPHENWEKNWVPFALADGAAPRVGLVYGHAPWQVLELTLPQAGAASGFTAAHAGPALRWAWGEIRGGTVPVRWTPAPGEAPGWLTFFHSSAVVGSRKLYFVGACVFDDTAPFAPRAMTPEPLFVAPYRSGAHEHGWQFAGSVVFPLGCAPTAGGWRLLAGLDDGLVATADVAAGTLRERLAPLEPEAAQRARAPHALDGTWLPPDGEPWTFGPHDEGALRAARLLALLHPGGGRLLDAAPGDGIALARLAPRCEAAEAWVAPGAERQRLARLLALNALDAAVDLVAPPAGPMDAAAPGRWAGLALLRVDDAETARALLPGAVQTLRREQPIVLLQLPADGAGRDTVETALAAAGYTCEALFPFTPQRRLALPAARREAFRWLV